MCCHYNSFAYVNLKRLDFKRQFVVYQTNMYQLEKRLITSAKDFFSTIRPLDHYVPLYIHLNIQKCLNNCTWNSTYRRKWKALSSIFMIFALFSEISRLLYLAVYELQKTLHLVKESHARQFFFPVYITYL